MLELILKAAEAGEGQAVVKSAQAYPRQLKLRLPFDIDKAKKYFLIAIDSHDPDGYHGLATILVAEDNSITEAVVNSKMMQRVKLLNAMKHLETAALLGHAFSMFNLGIAHVFGFGTLSGELDMVLRTEWFIQSGLPEGYYASSDYFGNIGNEERKQKWACC